MAGAEALGAILGYTGSLVGAAAQTEAVRQTNFAQRELAQYSFDQQRQMIAEQNAYNSPVAQMARYQEAGLNPNLIYGQIGGGNQSEIAKYNPPNLKAPDVGSLISNSVNAALSAMQVKADLDLKKQQAANLREEQYRIRAQRHGMDIENMWNALIKGFDPGLVTQAGDFEAMRNSKAFGLYDARIRDVNAMINYRNTMRAYYDVQAEVAGLNKEQKAYYNQEILPLMKEIMEKRRDGLDTSNDILELQKKFFTPDKIFGYATGLANSIARFIQPFSFGGGSPTSSSGFGSSWYGSPFYPDESYVPGL